MVPTFYVKGKCASCKKKINEKTAEFIVTQNLFLSNLNGHYRDEKGNPNALISKEKHLFCRKWCLLKAVKSAYYRERAAMAKGDF
jgi:hypothetical protein